MPIQPDSGVRNFSVAYELHRSILGLTSTQVSHFRLKRNGNNDKQIKPMHECDFLLRTWGVPNHGELKPQMEPEAYYAFEYVVRSKAGNTR
jgi:hypothetical protein